MSYLDLLNRASQGLAPDFHICMLKNPGKSRAIRKFFVGDEISSLWSRMSAIERESYDRMRGPRKNSVNRITPVGFPNKTDLDLTNEPLTSIEDDWLCMKNEYEAKKEANLNSLLQEAADSSSEDHPQGAQPEPSESNEKGATEDSSPPLSGKDFLLSLAGMFDSGMTDGSTNAESIVAKAILEKFERDRHGLSH